MRLLDRKTVIVCVLNLLIVLAGILYIRHTTPRVAYITVADVYNDFLLKKELEAKLEKTQSIQKNVLDTLAYKVRLLNRELENNEKNKSKLASYEVQRNEYLTKQKLFQQENSAASEEYSKQIWSQLNQYIKDYGSRYGYDIILGGNGSGSIMHADKSLDITAAVKIYVNNRYKGLDK